MNNPITHLYKQLTSGRSQVSQVGVEVGATGEQGKAATVPVGIIKAGDRRSA